MSETIAKRRNTGTIGKQFEREIQASIERLYPDLAGGRCKIPDEKGMRRRYYGEVRLADFAVPVPGGRTVYIECKSTNGARWPLRSISGSQEFSLSGLVRTGATVWVLVLYQALLPHPTRRAVAVPAGEVCSRWVEWFRAVENGCVRTVQASYSIEELVGLPGAVEIDRGPFGWDVGALFTPDIP